MPSTGRGTGDFLDAVVALLPDEGKLETDETVARLAIIGRPNVGKSTLLNKLAGEDRVLVSDVPGTTRDPINLVVELDGEPFEVIDTAGIKRRTKIKDDVEYYAVMRAREVLRRRRRRPAGDRRSAGATHQEQRLAEEIAEAGVGLVVLLNKWDVVDEDSRLTTEDSVADRLAFVVVGSGAAHVGQDRQPAASAAEGDSRRPRDPAAAGADPGAEPADPGVAGGPPAARCGPGKRPRIIYAVQAEAEPPTIVLFVRGGDLGPDYLRFLENRLRGAYDFVGTPVRLYTRRRHNRREMDL